MADRLAPATGWWWRNRRFDELVQTAELHVEPVTPDQARDAYRDFGKG